MKGHVSRITALIVLTILITVSYMIMVHPPLITLNDESNDDETYFPPDPRFSRPTRAGTDWPMHLNNPTHTSYTPDTGPTTSDVLWFNSTGGTTYGSPAVVDGMVYIGSRNSSLNEDYMNAFYANNGTLAWRNKTISNVPGGLGVTSSPAVDNGYVFFGGDGIYSLYENNGTIKWFVDTPAQNWGDGTPTVANGRVYIGGSDRKLYAVDQDTGNVDWTFQTLNNNPPLPNYGLYAAPAISNGYVILAACDGFVYKINETQLTPIATADYSFNSGNSIYSSPVVVNGRVYFGNGYTGTSTSNRFYCLYESNLTKIWEFYPGSATSFFSSAGYYNDKIYIGSIDGNLYSLNATGSGGTTWVEWQYNMGQTWSSPAITNDRLYIGSRGDYVYCFNLSQPVSPDYYWRYLTGGDVDSSPAVSDGKVYVASQGNNGRLYSFGSSVVPTVDRIEIENQSGGLGSPLPDFQTSDVGKTITGYAAAYNGTDYLYDVPVNWSVTNDSSTNASTNPTFFLISSDFYSGFYGGTAIWTADDGNGHTDNVTFWINPPEVDYIRIVDTEGTGTGEIGDKIVDVGNTTKGYAASFNDTTGYIGDVPVTWSVLNTSGAEGFTSPVSGSNSTLNVGLKNGTVEWIANYGLGRTDSVNFTVRKPTVDFITIMTGPNGTGSWVGDSTFVYGNSSTFYAGGFNETSGWVEDVPALWSSNNSFIGDVDPGPFNSTTFFTLNNGTCNITATYNTFSNTTGVLTVINYTVDYIIIRDASNNGGVWVGDRSFNVGETANFFAAAYNNTAPDDGYIGDISVVWESSDPSIATVTTPGASTLFTAQFLSGECNVTARYGSLITNTSGRLTVLPADIDYIVITDAEIGNELITVYLNVGQSIQIHASGYNSTGPTYVGPVNVDWTQSPLTIGSFSQSPGTSTIYAAGMSGGSTTIIANHTLSAMNDDFTIIINPPTVDYIQIRDAADGLGNIVTTRTYSVNETDEFYAAAYNNTANYLYDVFVFWNSNDTDVGQVTPQGVSTNFTAMNVDLDSICIINATLNPQISNSTGPLTVLAPRVDYIQIRDESGGKGNVTTTPNFTLGENVTDIYYCAAYNHTVGYIGDISAQWTVTGNIGTLSPSTGESTIFTATTAGTGIISANLTGIINSTGTITVIQVPDTTPPEAPTGLHVFLVEGGGALRLTWDENTEDDLAGYNIYRSLQNGSGFELINIEGLVTSASYLDTGLTNGTTYYYKITAVDESSNESPFSDTVHNTPVAEGEEDEEEFPILLILLPIIIIIIIIILILLILLFKRRKPEEAPPKPEAEKKDLPPPPSWMVGKEEETTSGKEEMPLESEIPEEKSPLTEDEEIPEDELPPPED